MNTIELIVMASSIIVALTIAFIAYVLLKPRKGQTEAKEQVTIEASIEAYDETAKLKARIEFLEAEIEKFATICDGLTAANKKCLDEFEAYVRLTKGEQEKPVKRSVTSLKRKECIRIGDGDWEKLAPLFEEAGIVWLSGSKASKFIPQIGWCVSTKSRGEGKLTQFDESHWTGLGFTVLPASDFIEPEPIEAPKPVKHLSEVNAIDWSKPVAFPKGYAIPVGIKVIKVGKNDEWVRKGSIGTVKESDIMPSIKWDNEDYDLGGGGREWAQHSYHLAPINQTDHPNHPEFKNK